MLEVSNQLDMVLWKNGRFSNCLNSMRSGEIGAPLAAGEVQAPAVAGVAGRVGGAVWEEGGGTDSPDGGRHQDLEREELEDRDLARDRHSVMAELDEINSRIVALGYGGDEEGKGTHGEFAGSRVW